MLCARSRLNKIKTHPSQYSHGDYNGNRKEGLTPSFELEVEEVERDVQIGVTWAET